MALQPSIAIIGAGPAGLTLARLLQVSEASVSITIFEKDASATARLFQGGTLDLHPTTGLAALKKAGLWEEFEKYARYEGEELVIADKNGTELIHMSEYASKDDPHARPEIDREKLKDMLLVSVGPEKVQWGKQLAEADAVTGILKFKDGSSAGPFDLVVGADGAWSKIRPVLSDVRPTYSGICGFESHICEPTTMYPKLSKLIGRGSYFAYSDCKGWTSQRMSDDSIKTASWVMREENYPQKILEEVGKDEEKLKDIILSDFTDWMPEIQELARVGTRFRAWNLYELPVGHRWDHKKGWTMIGDSAHLMTPFAGEGVNAAMKDALELSEAIAEGQKENLSIDDAVRKFEEGMFPRAASTQQETMRNKTTMFRADAPIGFMIEMMGVVAQETGYSLDKGILSWIPVRSIAYAYFWTQTSFGVLSRKIRSLIWRK